MKTNLAVIVEDRGCECIFYGDVPAQPLYDAFTVPMASYGMHSLFDLSRRSLPSGLLDEAIALMKVRGIAVKVTRAPLEPAPVFKWSLRGVKPHPFQEEAAGIALSRHLSFIQLPCGSGKTIVALAVIARLGIPALVLLHRANLARQFAQAAREVLGVEPGIWAAGGRSLGPVTVACVQSVRGREAELSAFDAANGAHGFPLVIVDEAHHSASPGYFATLSALPCSRRLGISGTSARGNVQEDRIVRAFFGRPVEVRDPAALATEGFCARIAVEIESYGGKPVPLCSPWKDLYENMQNHRARNEAIARKVRSFCDAGVPVLVLVGSRGHGRYLKALLEEGGIGVPFLSAADSVDTRARALDRFRAGLDPVMIASQWVNEGIDLPDLGAVVLCGGFHARPATIQRVGRVLRLGSAAKGGVGHIVDFDDRELHPLLGQHLVKRLCTYRDVLKAELGAAARMLPSPADRPKRRNKEHRKLKSGKRTALNRSGLPEARQAH